MKKTLILSFVIGSSLGFSQAITGSHFKSEFSLVTDNDVFFFKDYYYSAGQDLIYKKLLRPDSRIFKVLAKNDTSKVIVIYKAGLKIYTPKEISQTEISKMDRPYAGLDYLSLGAARFNKVNRGSSFAIDAGLVGKASGLGQFQGYWHKVLHLRTPRGWGYQISNEVVLNLAYQHWQSWRVANKVDLISTTTVFAGTMSNKLSQAFNFRFLKFNSLKNSNFTRSILSSRTIATPEFFFFGGLGVDYVVSTIFIEGSLFESNKSPFVVDALPYIFRQHLGLMYSRASWSYSATMNRLSKEVASGKDHIYASIEIGIRF